eukprot:1986307-Prymnesium_polylepis.1
MYVKLEERAGLMDAQLVAFERTIGETRPDLPPVASLLDHSAEDVTVCGRVCCEGEGKLNGQSIFLEGSRAMANATRLRLDLKDCAEYALYPGQLVAAVGVSATGRTFSARRIIAGAPPPPPLCPPASDAAAEAVTMLVAAGPFTTTDNVDYTPLAELLRAATSRKVSGVVLLGPFVDEQHPHVASLDVPMTFDNLFEQRVLQPI